MTGLPPGAWFQPYDPIPVPGPLPDVPEPEIDDLDELPEPALPVGEEPVPWLPRLDDVPIPTPAREPLAPAMPLPLPHVPGFRELIDEWIDRLRWPRERGVPDYKVRLHRERWVRRLYDGLLDQLNQRRLEGNGPGTLSAGAKSHILERQDVRGPLKRLIDLFMGGWYKNKDFRRPPAPAEDVHELARRAQMLVRCYISPTEFVNWLYEQMVPPLAPVGDVPGRPGNLTTRRKVFANRLLRQIRRGITTARGSDAPPFFGPHRPRGR